MSVPASRQPRGIPAGGQFAASARAEGPVDLADPAADPAADPGADQQFADLPVATAGVVHVVDEHESVVVHAADWKTLSGIVTTLRDGGSMTSAQRAFVRRLQIRGWATDDQDVHGGER